MNLSIEGHPLKYYSKMHVFQILAGWPPFNFNENGKPGGFSIDFKKILNSGKAIDQALENRIDVYRQRNMDCHGHHDSRKEVMR